MVLVLEILAVWIAVALIAGVLYGALRWDRRR